jgi:hypothetical protein
VLLSLDVFAALTVQPVVPNVLAAFVRARVWAEDAWLPAELTRSWLVTYILANVGHRVGRSTIARILRTHGILPMPERPSSWQTFLQAHWGEIAGADFFTTEVWTWRGLVTFYTVFVVELASRRVQIRLLLCLETRDRPHPQSTPSPYRFRSGAAPAAAGQLRHSRRPEL